MPLAPNQLLTLELKIYGKLAAAGGNDLPCQNVFHYRRTSVGVNATKGAFLTRFVAAIMTPYLAAASDRYFPQQYSLRWIDDPTDREVFTSTAAQGAIATDSEPSHDAVSMLLRTNLRGANYRGSKHWGGVNESDTTGDVLTGGGLALWVALRDALRLPLVDAIPLTWNLVVLSRSPLLSNFTMSPALYTATDVSEVQLNKRIGSMERRRKAKSVFAP